MGQMAREIEQMQQGLGQRVEEVPHWVPRSVQNYLDHTEMGIPIRALAREQGCHASTIMRQIRRVETLRDDPLVDGMLKTLGGATEASDEVPKTRHSVDIVSTDLKAAQEFPDMEQLGAHALRVLRRLCETGAILVVSADMEKGIILRGEEGNQTTRTAVVDRAIVEAMALKGWIVAPTEGRISKYQITAAGRNALANMIARDECMQAAGTVDHGTLMQRTASRRIRYSMAESPMAALARRKDRSGERFLDGPSVHAGERLREDFELAEMKAEILQDWDGFWEKLRNGASQPSIGNTGIARARLRVIAALQDLGPGLSEVTLRCCCLLEGLETAEKKLGWSARSGKIVLRIALLQLASYYAEDANIESAMIG